MVAEIGCKYVIVGHSERRALYGESDATAAAKAAAVVAAGMTPVVCMGETLTERDAGATEAIVLRQLDAVAAHPGVRIAETVLAYEPVWAIGTGRTATPEQAHAVHKAIRKRRGKAGTDTLLLYGGSVKASNAKELFAMPDIDGGLIGGVALKADEFLAVAAA